MVLRKSGRVDSRRFRMRVQAKTTLDDESRFSFGLAFFVFPPACMHNQTLGYHNWGFFRKNVE